MQTQKIAEKYARENGLELVTKSDNMNNKSLFDFQEHRAKAGYKYLIDQHKETRTRSIIILALLMSSKISHISNLIDSDTQTYGKTRGRLSMEQARNEAILFCDKLFIDRFLQFEHQNDKPYM